MMLFFSLRLGILPSSGAGDWRYMVMPVLSLALPSAAFISRITRSTMLDTISEDYVMTARAKGCPPMRIIFSHELRNAMMPVVTDVGMSFAGLLGGSVIVENVFGLPGFGNIILNAINTQDSPVLMASVILLSFIFMLVMLVIYMLMRWMFYWMNIDSFQDVTFKDMMTISWGGMRFDLSALCYLNAICILLQFLPIKNRHTVKYQKAVKIIFLIINILGMILKKK